MQFYLPHAHAAACGAACSNKLQPHNVSFLSNYRIEHETERNRSFYVCLCVCATMLLSVCLHKRATAYKLAVTHTHTLAENEIVFPAADNEARRQVQPLAAHCHCKAIAAALASATPTAPLAAVLVNSLSADVRSSVQKDTRSHGYTSYC